MTDWKHEQFKQRLDLTLEDKVNRKAWDDEYHAQRAADGTALRGLAIGIVFTLALAWGVYRIIHWYVSTMPPHSFIGLKHDGR